MSAVDTAEVAVEITRTFAVPREQVFRAWTEASRLMQWFAPKGFTVASCDSVPGPDGAFRACLRSPQGLEYWVRGTYREVEAPKRLLLACIAEDHAGVPRLEERIEVRLEARGDGTELHLRALARGLDPAAETMVRAMPAVWAQTIDGLSAHLSQKS